MSILQDDTTTTWARPARVGAVALLVVVAVLLQVTVVARLPLPLGAPDLLGLVVLSVAVRRGPAAGTVTGFAAGLLADAASQHTIGRLALVLALVGYLAGLLSADARRSVVVPWLAVSFGTVVAFLGFTTVGALIGDPQEHDLPLAARSAGLALYGLLLTPLLYPLVAALLGRLDP